MKVVVNFMSECLYMYLMLGMLGVSLKFVNVKIANIASKRIQKSRSR